MLSTWLSGKCRCMMQSDTFIWSLRLIVAEIKAFGIDVEKKKVSISHIGAQQ